jgi:hypothetical protein
VEFTDKLKQVTGGRGRVLHSREHECHIFSGARQFAELLRSRARIVHAQDVIVVGVPLGQLRLDHAQRITTFIDGE